MINLVGRTFLHYQILVRVRETPTRVLYRAYNTRTQAHAAVEFVKSMGIEPSELLQLLNEQVRKNTELVHPNIARISDSGIHDGLIYIVYSFAPTQPLRRFFNRTYSWQEMARELVSITHAMAYAHEKGVIHGALHPSSIVLDEKRNPMLFDFGFEQIISTYLLAVSPGAWINRWGYEYRAPEQLNGAPPDSRCDVYAMGIMLHEWLLGRIALLESTILDTLQVRKKTGKAFEKKSSVPTTIQNLIEKCISPNPNARYQSMQEVYIVLARGALDMSITRKMIRKPLQIPRRRFKFRMLPTKQMGVMSIVIFALIAIFAWALTGSNRLRPTGQATASATTTASQPATQAPTATDSPSIATDEPVAEITPFPEQILFPAFQNTPIASAIRQTITADNINRMVMLSIWGSGDITHLASSPDGRTIAAASSIGIFIFDAQTLDLQRHIDTRSWITAIQFSPDGKSMASGDRSGLIQLWDTGSWEELGAPFSRHTQSILDITFSPDGAHLASVGLDQLLIQWDLNARDSQPNQIPANEVKAIDYSADGTRLITGGNDLIINILDSRDLSFVQKKDFPAQVVDIARIPDSSLLAIGGNHQSIVLLDLNNGPSLVTVGRLQYSLTGVAAAPDGKSVAAGDINGGIGIWDITNEDFAPLSKPQNYVAGNPADIDLPGSPHSLAFSADSKTIFSGVHNGNVRSLNASTGAQEKEYLLLNAHAERTAISHNSQYLITQQENRLTIWDLQTGRPLDQLQGELKDGDPFSQDDSMFVFLGTDTNPVTVNVYNPANSDEVYTLASQRGVKAIQFLDDGRQLITVYEQAVDLWSMASGQALKSTRTYDGTGCQLIKDINGQNVASITNYHHVVTDSDNKAGLCVYEPRSWRTTFINESASLIAYGDNSTLAIVNAQNVDDVQNMSGVNRKNIVKVALSPEGDLLAAAFDDHTIHIWDIATREEIASLYGHSDSITDLRFTPDSKLLISTSTDGTIRLWGVPY